MDSCEHLDTVDHEKIMAALRQKPALDQTKGVDVLEPWLVEDINPDLTRLSRHHNLAYH